MATGIFAPDYSLDIKITFKGISLEELDAFMLDPEDYSIFNKVKQYLNLLLSQF